MTRHRILFLGTPSFAARGLQELLELPSVEVAAVITQPDRPAGRGSGLRPSPVKELAAKHSIPVLQPPTIRRERQTFLDAVGKFGPFDLGVVIAFGQILPSSILNLPARGCVNVHASLLPRWRGAAPIQRAIMAGDRETGVCLMKMEEGLDTGPVFSSKSLPLEPDANFGRVHDALAEIGADLLRSDIERIIRGEIDAIVQPSEGVTYAKKISNEEAHIDWSRDAESIRNLIRGLSPLPGAFTIFKGKRLKIFAARSKEPFSNLALGTRETEAPGEVLLTDRNLIEVRCGKGVLSLDELQLEGKKRLPVAEFVKSGLLLAGTQLQ